MSEYSESHKSTLEIYQKSVGKHSILSKKEEDSLKKEVASGVSPSRLKEIKNRLIEGNLRLAFEKAKKYQGLGLPLEDLVMEANVGLCRAAEEFNFAAKTRFSSYAGYWIQASLTESVQNKSRLIRIPVNHQHQIANEKKANDGVSLTEARHGRRINIHAPLGEDGDILADVIENPFAEAPDAQFMGSGSLGDDLQRLMLVVLDEREQRILKESFGFYGEERGLVEIAEEEGISAERVRQIKQNALAKMKKFSHKLLD